MLIHFQSPIKINNPNWYSQNFKRKSYFGINKEKMEYMLQIRNIELLAFSISETKFEILIKNISEGLASVYMHRVLTGYSKYFNSKYKVSGHVFSGPFNAEKVQNKKSLIEKSALIHQLDSATNENSPETYRWSSFVDYTVDNRWGEFLKTADVMGSFKTQTEYKIFVLNYTKKGLN